jgi:hypothetical protein
MTSQEVLESPHGAVQQVLEFAPAFAAAVLADAPARLDELTDRLRAAGDPVAALHAVVEAEDLAHDVARVKWLTTHLTSPARWLATKVADAA